MYEPLVPLTRRNEKLMAFLTIEQSVAVCGPSMGFFLLVGRSLPLPFAILGALGLALVGFILSTRVRGMPLYERAWWLGRAIINHAAPPVRDPSELPGTVAVVMRPIESVQSPIQTIDEASVLRGLMDGGR